MKIILTNPYEDEFVKLYKKENKGVERMVEQRFKLDSEVGFIDTQKCGGDTMTHFEVVVELNNLHKENEQLKRRNNGLQFELQIFKEEVKHSDLQINKLVDENERLKKRLIKLKEENAELKEENETLWCDVE